MAILITFTDGKFEDVQDGDEYEIDPQNGVLRYTRIREGSDGLPLRTIGTYSPAAWKSVEDFQSLNPGEGTPKPETKPLNTLKPWVE